MKPVKLLSMAAAIWSILAAGCGSEGTDGERVCDVRGDVLLLVPQGETTLEEAQITITPVQGPPHSMSCGLGGRSCAEPISLTGEPLDRLFVRAPGFVHLDQAWSGVPAQRGSCDTVHRAALEPVEPVEVTDDYATGFALGQLGMQQFEALATTMSTELGPTEVVKFVILGLDTDEPEVYFQNSKTHPIHYDFITQVLGRPMTYREFMESTYSGDPRPNMAGTLLWYRALTSRCSASDEPITGPMVITFFPSDDLTPIQALTAYDMVLDRLGFVHVTPGASPRLLYLPAGSLQEDQLLEAEDRFLARGALWVYHRELYGSLTEQILNPGLAYGRLKLLTPEELEREVVSYTDILVLPRLPARLPLVGGTITGELQTPLAHVNLAARTRGTPNVAVPGVEEDPRVAHLVGELVRFEVTDHGFTLEESTEEEVRRFWEGRHRERFVPEYDLSVDGLPGFDDLGFPDSMAVGVKAANLAELHGLMPDTAPDGFAVPFHHYDEFMSSTLVDEDGCDEARADCLDEGRSQEVCRQARDLCVPPRGTETLYEHAERLIQDQGFMRDSVLREACLDNMVYLVGHGPVDDWFADMLDAKVEELVGDGTVRLRSSTNAEDLPGFTGAGLYRSVSAKASGKKRASKRIRKVWASVWSFRAFEERSFWNIDHMAVRMGVAVHRSFPDEQANGVLITQNVADPTVAGMYVNVQAGEVSVTNPEGGELPEIFTIVPGPGGTVQVIRQRYSTLSPGAPILTDDEVALLYRAASRVQDHFAGLYQEDPNLLALDLEFKFTGPNRELVLKQVRPAVLR